MDGKTLEALNVVNDHLGGKIKVALVPVDQFDFLEENARFFTQERFSNLVNNVKMDGQLSSVPFCQKIGDRFKVLSGNHRCKAAIEAGLESVLVMYTEEDLSPSKSIAIQLSHNSLVGEDDMEILKDLFNQIDDVEFKRYAGLDDKTLDMLEKANIKALAEAAIDYRSVAFVMLPEELEMMEESFENARREIGGKDMYIGRFKDYDRFVEAINAAQDSYGIKNYATALAIILDVFESNMEHLQDGWVTDAHDKRMIPVGTVSGSDRIKGHIAEKMLGVFKRERKKNPKFSMTDFIEQACENWSSKPKGE